MNVRRLDCEKELKEKGYRLLNGSITIYEKGSMIAWIEAYNESTSEEAAKINYERRLRL